jgi:hypothetical protein
MAFDGKGLFSLSLEKGYIDDTGNWEIVTPVPAGITIVAGGKPGNTLQMTGVAGAFISLAASTGFYISTGAGAGQTDYPRSFEAWVNFDVIKTQGVLSKIGGSAFEWGFNYSAGIGMNLSLYTTNTGGTYIRCAIPEVNFAINTWYHIVFTYDGSKIKEGIKGYLNGNLFTTTNTTAGTYTGVRIGAQPVYIGLLTNNFTGKLDSVRMYNTVLTADEVTELYNGGLGLNPFGSKGSGVMNYFLMS